MRVRIIQLLLALLALILAGGANIKIW